MLVAIEGMDEVAIAAGVDQGPRRVIVGRRPTAVAVSPDGEFAYVADSLDDTISVVATATGQRPATIPLGPRPELSAADRGERLFSSARVSHDGWMSCQSCHTDGHTNGLSSDTLGDGSYGAPKRVPSLLRRRRDRPVDLDRLDGPAGGPGAQVDRHDHARHEAHRRPGRRPDRIPPHAVAARAADVGNRRWTVPPSPAASRSSESRKCASCHEPPEYTTPQMVDVGLADEVGNREFNPPSLRAVSRRDAFLHDGRADSLREVFAREHHPRGLELSPREIDDLVAFLGTL